MTQRVIKGGAGRAGEQEPSAGERFCNETVLGTVVEWSESGAPVVEYQGPSGETLRCPALCTVRIERTMVGHGVVLMFIRGEPDRPVIMGGLGPGVATPPKRTRTRTLVLDGRALEFEADSALTLRCGKASITLTRDGQITLRGTNLVSHASGVNRIRGGTITLN